MSRWRHLFHGLRSLLKPAQREQDVADEVQHYFEEAEASWKSRGLSVEEARRAARMEAGDMAVARDRLSSYGWESAIYSALSDVRLVTRQLLKHKVFTATAVLTLALGIGTNSAIFTVVQSVLLAPLPYADANKLVALTTHWTNTGRTSDRVTGPDASDIRNQSRSLQAVSFYSGGTLGVQLRDHATYTGVALIDADFQRVFNLQPLAGRLLTAADAHHAAFVSAAFARENFSNEQAAIGQILHVENEPVEIVGVLPDRFNFPAGTNVWEAFPLQPESQERTAFNYRAVGRMRSDNTLQRTRTELIGISRQLEIAYPEANRGKQILPVPLQQALTGSSRSTLLFLWAAVALILLIACVNVTHLQLVRSLERQRELAIRQALGSSRWRSMQPVVLESLLLSLLGGVAGVALAFPTVRILVALAPATLSRANQIHMNGWVLSFTLVIAILTALASSILPALRAGKVDPSESLKIDASRGMSHQGTNFLRDGLVVAEVAATFVLAVGAALLLHTMMTLANRDMGYQTRQLLIADADLPAHSEQDAHRAVLQLNEIFTRLAALPGVLHVAGIMGLPTGDYGSNGYYTVSGAGPIDPNHSPYANFSVSSPGYFRTIGIPIKRGRDFADQDSFDNPFVAVVSESLARQSFGNADPLGRQIQCGLDTDKWMTIIGVVGDVRQNSPAENPGPVLYMPMAQHPYYANQIHIVLRTSVSPLNLMNAVKGTIVKVNPLVAMRFTTMDAMVGRSIATERFRAVLTSSFAGIGLLLAMLGIYGTVAYTVTQRTFEIGIRMAFGADKHAILGQVLAHAGLLAACGIMAGLTVSLLLVRLLATMLIGVRPTDPISLCIPALLIFVTALLAALGPGWKATHISPLLSLRSS